MTGNISYLSEHEPYDEGYVSFGHGGGKITGKGTIKTGKLEFKNVDFVKELKYNLFSVSQIYDNKNSVLFTDSECLVLGKDFKLVDDTHVLLRTPRQHNMYSIDLNNIVPHKNLTCLIAKAFVDEGMLWHRRCDNGGEFKNREMDEFCTKKAARTMLADAKLPVTFWAEAHSTAYYVQNRVLVNKSHNKTPYELFNGRILAIGTSSTNILGTKEDANQAVKDIVSSLRFIALPNWFHDAHMETYNDSVKNSEANDDPQKEQDGTVDVSESSGNTNPTASSKDSLADQVEPVLSPTMESEVPTVSSPVPTVSTNALDSELPELPTSPTVETAVPTVSTPIPTDSKSIPPITSSCWKHKKYRSLPSCNRS
ncbi:ribonuclease H-like domain-containing protein [Tanacetum coccineum]